MDEKRITAAEFDEAVHKAIDKMIRDPQITGPAKFLIPLTGATFATKVREILFPDDAEVPENEQS